MCRRLISAPHIPNDKTGDLVDVGGVLRRITYDITGKNVAGDDPMLDAAFDSLEVMAFGAKLREVPIPS